jgi:hypothetical protein
MSEPMRGTAHPARSLPALAALMVLAIAWAPPLAAKDTSRVTLTVPMPARIDMGGIRTVLVTRFIVDQEAESVDVNSEMVALLRSQLRKRTNLRILDVDPPALPEQPLSQLLANTGFWRKLAETYGADLVIAGKVGFEVSDRSGFVERDEISPLTGQRIRRTRFVDREGILLDMNLFFIRGSTGQLQYEDHLTGENTLMGTGNDRLSSLFVLYEQFEDDILGIVVPSAKTVQRFLFTE